MPLGKNIKTIREALGMQATELSAISGVEIGTISALENRDSLHSRFTFQLAEALGIKMEDLMRGDLLNSPTVLAEIVERAHPVRKSDSAPGKYVEDGVVISQYDVSGVAGLVLEGQTGIIHKWVVTPEWLRLHVHGCTSERNLCLVTTFGPSMRPRFNSGDPLLMDCGVTTVQTDGVYFFRVGKVGYIKQLQRIPVGDGIVFRAKSYNPDYDPFDITEAMDFEVFGQILKAWRGEDF
jgi:phage repressor protein C with HTH and peptisase S24 domain